MNPKSGTLEYFQTISFRCDHQLSPDHILASLAHWRETRQTLDRKCARRLSPLVLITWCCAPNSKIFYRVSTGREWIVVCIRAEVGDVASAREAAVGRNNNERGWAWVSGVVLRGKSSSSLISEAAIIEGSGLEQEETCSVEVEIRTGLFALIQLQSSSSSLTFLLSLPLCLAQSTHKDIKKCHRWSIWVKHNYFLLIWPRSFFWPLSSSSFIICKAGDRGE